MKTLRLIAVMLGLALTAACLFAVPVLAEGGEAPVTPTDLPDVVDDMYDGGFQEDSNVIMYDIAGETMTISEDVDAEGKNANVTAVRVTSRDGEQSSVTIEGGITALGECDHYSHGTSSGLELYSAGAGSTAEATITEGIVSAMQWTNPDEGDNINCAGLSITVDEGGKADVTVKNGGIHTEASLKQDDDQSYTWAAGVHLYNTDGKATVSVTGDVTAESYVYGIGLNSHLYGFEEASTVITVEGDVYGTTRAIWAELENPDGTMELIVDGAVSGGVDPILVSGADKNRILLTVWKVVPNSDGVLVKTFDENDEDIPSEEDTAALRYILRVSPANDGPIETDAEDYRGYRIAKADDIVKVRVTAPEGRRIVSVFADQERTIALEKDAEGNYLLTVPRGGGVELSFITRAINNASSASAAVSAPAMVAADDTDDTGALKDSVQDTDALPDSVKDMLTAAAMRIREILTLTLTGYTEDAGTPEFILPVNQQYKAGEKALVAFAVQQGDRFVWFTADAVGTDDGRLSVRPDAAALRALSGETFLAFIITE